MNYLNLINLDIMFLGVAIAANAILAFVVFLNDRKSITNQTFLLFAILTVCWSSTNFLVTRFSSPIVVLWLLRLAVFFAVWHSFAFFNLFYVFPKPKVAFSFLYKYILLPIVCTTSILTLTPFVFARIEEFSIQGQVTSVINGPAIALFGVVVVGCILGGLLLMVKKMIQASGMEKIQFRYILIGATITFLLLIIFNFVLPAFLNNARFVPLGALFILPFAFFTTYAIIKHHLLNVKVVATEILTFVLAIASLIEIIISEDIRILIFRISTFVLLMIFGILLIKSVRKEVEQREKLQELSKAKSEFMSIASHQLRTPLSIIKGYLSMMQEGSFGPITEQQKQAIEKSYMTNEEMMVMVNDLLNLTRAEEGRLQYNFEKTDVKELVEQTAKSLEVALKTKNLSLTMQLPSIPVFVNADKDKLRQVISNLLDNAVKYTEQGGINISIIVKIPEKTVLIRVHDTGLGIEAEEMRHLFESFSRGKAGTKSWTKGSGLGLYIAKQFLQAHKGKIWAESQGENKGSTFFVELPLV